MPAIPFEVEFAGALFDTIILADKSESVTVLTDAFDEGLRSTNTRSVLATFAAVGSSDTFLLLSAIINQTNLMSRGKYYRQRHRRLEQVYQIQRSVHLENPWPLVLRTEHDQRDRQCLLYEQPNQRALHPVS